MGCAGRLHLGFIVNKKKIAWNLDFIQHGSWWMTIAKAKSPCSVEHSLEMVRTTVCTFVRLVYDLKLKIDISWKSCFLLGKYRFRVEARNIVRCLLGTRRCKYVSMEIFTMAHHQQCMWAKKVSRSFFYWWNILVFLHSFCFSQKKGSMSPKSW